MKKTGFIIVMILWVASLSAADYTLTVDGTDVPAVKFKHYHYASFDMAAPVEVSLTCGFGIESFDVSPHHRAIRAVREGNTLRFTLDRTGYVMVRVNDTERFFIFAEEPETVPRVNAVSILSFGVTPDGTGDVTRQIKAALKSTASRKQTLVFPAGTYTCGQLEIPAGAHIHLCRGAVLEANPASASTFHSGDDVKTKRFLYIKNADNVRITGYGAVNGNGARMRAAFGDDARIRLILAVGSRNLTVEGIMLQDPGSWNTQILKCDDVIFRHVKLMNDVQISNTDGFDPDAVRNLVIEDCFAYCSDDNVAIKSTGYSGYLADVDGVVVRRCVFLTKKSSLKVGTETKAARMQNILFEDNDVIESDRGMALYVSDGTSLVNVSFVGNRFERNHPDAKQAGIHFVVNRRSEKSPLGEMKNILVKDCAFETAFPKRSEVKYPEKSEGVEVVFDNLTIGGVKMTSPKEANMNVQNANVIFR